METGRLEGWGRKGAGESLEGLPFGLDEEWSLLIFGC